MRNKLFAGLVGLTVVLLLAGSLPAAAQTPEIAAEEVAPPTEFSVAVIDTRRVVAESEIGRGMGARAEAVAAEWEQRITILRQELDGLGRRRAQEALTLTTEALVVLDNEIGQKNLQLQRLDEDARRELTNLSQSLITELNGVLGPSLERFARQRGFHLILDSAKAVETGLLYWSSEIDVTTDFIDQLDRANVAQWRGVNDEQGLQVGQARVPGSDWLRQMMFEDALRTLRR